MAAATGVLGKGCALLEKVARLYVTRFLRQYISTGCLVLLEERMVQTFEGSNKGCSLKSVIKVHNPVQFYWKEACLAPARYLFHHVSRQNSLTEARRNISHHYDLKEDEELKTAQLRKISILIEKARITKNHEVLELGCGWGGFAIEVVKQTGCRYTGITLSKEQVQFAEKKVNDAGLHMLEHVGHEFMEEFFSCCDSMLAENGLLILQGSSDFIKEYIFPGGLLPSLSRVTSAMVASSRFSVQHLENIGIHYYQTLGYWRKTFSERHSEILALGFDEKFIRTWEYYFDYCAAGFNSCTLGNYQIVFSRPGNVLEFSDLYKGFPSAY
ncbi:putative cyclopropane-fatty-acyl-phospholipid synthase [Rosa chinensis]|uniref:Putative cyclopropane-fatty-acyl-phospholipid synthase n=1 Tax=Rosa chinensis TaxID=74649 RepID=A0A2P6SJ51_ROSCH|nr:putative cyclopropane-fatty-acyl-phospholipid synthase [Rosa chinensis]